MRSLHTPTRVVSIAVGVGEGEEADREAWASGQVLAIHATCIAVAAAAHWVAPRADAVDQPMQSHDPSLGRAFGEDAGGESAVAFIAETGKVALGVASAEVGSLPDVPCHRLILSDSVEQPRR
jgi:hypothetical protein